jgi:hypothetical protein
MKVILDDERYELLMLDYQITEIARLNEVLKQNGIKDPALRAGICAEFADANGAFLDQGWLEGEAPGRYWPELVFSKRPRDPGEGLGGIQELVLPGYASNFHEYVSGAIEFYFEENKETIGEIRTSYL